MKKISIILPLVALCCGSQMALMAAEDKAKKGDSFEAVVTPEVTYVDVSGNKSKFREDTWMKDGLSGGLENFKLNQKLWKDGYFSAEGRALYNQRDYDVRLELVKPDFGFLRAGISQYPKYFNNMGLFYEPLSRGTNGAGVLSPFAGSAFGLTSNPQLDIGKIFFEAGLTLPNLPKIEFGYEHQFKDGTKSMLEGGSVQANVPAAGGLFPSGSVSKKIYPGIKAIDERVDIFKLGVEHSFGPIELGDNFYFEKYANDTGRNDTAGYYITDGSQKLYNVRESFHHDMFSNTYHMEHHVNDKVYWSMGHLFTSLTGDGVYSDETLYGPAGTLAAVTSFRDHQWVVPKIYVKQESHVGNFNVMVGPFAGLTAHAGIQGEKTATDGSASGNFKTTTIPTSNIVFRTSYEKSVIEEILGLRFTKIPYTVVYADAKWAQENLTEQLNGATDYVVGRTRLTEDSRQQDYKAGFSTSPWSRMTLTGQYRCFRTDNVSTTNANHTGTTPMSAYGGFLHDQSFQGNDINTKLSMRVSSRVTVALKYQMLSEDIYNTTEAPAAGYLKAADYFANIYSLSVTATPMNRLYVTGLISYQDTTTTAYDNNSNAIAPYKGNVYTVNGTAGFLIDNKTDLTADYTFSHTDNFLNNGSGTTAGTDYGIPFRVSNDLQALNFRLTRRITENISVGLRYGFYKYNESYTGGINDYTAHLASANCTIRF